MSAVTDVPALSRLLAWPTEHLTEAATHWDTLGERSYEVAHGVWSDALAADWDGEAATALRTDTHADMMTTSAVVDQLQEAASVARSGASELDVARSRIRYTVDDARSAGFVVGEDLSVTDRMVDGSAARQAAAQALAGKIGQRAAQLVNLDAHVAGRITSAVAGVGSTFPQTPQTPPRNGHVRAVDVHAFKQDPPPTHSPEPKGPSAGDMRKVLEQLPRGSRDTYRNIKSPEDLERLKQWMIEHGTDMPSHYDEPEKGEWKRLPDGSEVGERNTADSTGQKALDIDLKGPDGRTEYWKIHINPEKGGVPEIPAAVPAPAKPAPAESAPSRAAPVKPGPGEGFILGGPPGMPSEPSFVPFPGSKHHLAPIIGEDDPGESGRDFSH